MTPYEEHKQRWSKCQRCELYKNRRGVVLARGSIPCDVAFVGEAPGVSEDLLGKPFVGPAGKLLDHIIEKALNNEFSFCVFNLVACLPMRRGAAPVEPSAEAIDACRPRLRQMIRLCEPKLLVTIGTTARENVSAALWSGPRVEIAHPAAILQMSIAQRGFVIQQSIHAIADGVTAYIVG